ncbi:MAG: hypothetical protein Q9166_006387 [cf. Caloplaca sp. 2 TL-2023]
MDSAHRHEPSSSFDSADGSHHGTPDTRLTALSPEDFRLNQSITTNQPPAFSLGAVPSKGNHKANAPRPATAAYHDPFVSSKPGPTTASSRESSKNKLSPIAPSFTPLAHVGNVGESVVSSSLMVPAGASSGGLVYSPGSVRSSPILPQSPYGQVDLEGCLLSVPNRMQFSHSSQDSSPSQRQPTKSGQFSSNGFISRSVVISHVDRRTLAADIDGLINPAKFPSRKHLVLENLPVTGTVYASFTDIRDAIEVVKTLHGCNGNWLVQYLSVPDFPTGSHQDEWKDLLAPKYEGQILVKAEFSGPVVFFNKDTVGRLILDLLNNYGGIMAYDAVITVHPVVAYRAEFFDVKDADHAIVHLNGFRIAGCTMNVQPYRDEGPLIIGQEDTYLDDRFSQMGLDGIPAPPEMPMRRSPLPSPYSVATPSHDGTLTPGLFNAQNSPSISGGLSLGCPVPQFSDGSPTSQYLTSYPASGMQSPVWTSFDAASSGPGAIGQERYSPLPSFGGIHQYPRGFVRHDGRHIPDFSGGHHNVVEIDRIRKGADVRTTIMLRNIPNKIDQAMLKDIVDETSWGRYDFMYLRIDFANNCNVGYAFINFEDPYYIIEFVNARSGHRWNRFNSDKVAEVSYASKIFRTGDDPMAGTEEPFPGPDNPSKMRRSVENAEHVGEASSRRSLREGAKLTKFAVGLFAPRAGQNFRDEQRRRRSQYDRGTRLAEIEDSYRFNHRLSRFRHAIQHVH